VDPGLISPSKTQTAKSLGVPDPGEAPVVLGTPYLDIVTRTGWVFGDELIDQGVDADAIAVRH
jgi:hypothetical protein